MEGVEDGAAVAEEIEGLIRESLAHLFAGLVPVSGGPVEIAATAKDAGFKPRFDGAGEGEDEGAHGISAGGDALRVDFGALGEIGDGLADVGDHKAGEVAGDDGAAGDLVVLARTGF